MMNDSEHLAVRRVLLLKRTPWLSDVHASDLAVLAERARDSVSPRGATLLRGGEPVDAIHFILDGRVRLVRRGRELGVATAGAVVGARLLLAHDADGLDAVAEEDTTAFVLDRESFLDALEERFAIYVRVLRHTCRELVALFLQDPLEAAPPPPDGTGALGPERDLDLVERIVLLRRRPPFEAYSINALAELSQRLEEVRRPAGSVIWRRGDRPSRMLFVASGRIRCEPIDREATFRVGAGQPIGTLELLGGVPRWYDAVAEEPVTALEGGQEQLVDVLEDNVDMGLGFLAHLASVWVALRERVGARGGSLHPLFACSGACG